MDADKLNEIADRLEIQDVKALFLEVIDNAHHDPAQAAARLGDLFAEDVKADYGAAGFFHGREAVTEFLIGVSSKPDWLWHSLHSPRIEVTGDTAVGHWTMNGHAKMKESEDLLSSTNRCRDEFTRTSEGWKFSLIRTIQEGLAHS